MNTKEDAQKEMELYLLSNPQILEIKDKVDQSLLLLEDGTLKRFEFILDLNISLLEELSNKIGDLKKTLKVKES